MNDLKHLLEGRLNDITRDMGFIRPYYDSYHRLRTKRHRLLLQLRNMEDNGRTLKVWELIELFLLDKEIGTPKDFIEFAQESGRTLSRQSVSSALKLHKEMFRFDKRSISLKEDL